MRAAVLLAIVVLVSCGGAPATPEYAKAKAAYQAAMSETADVTYRGERWDQVLALLRAVPASNAREHQLAEALATDIEQTRKRIAKDLKAVDAVADKLLDLPSLPSLLPIEPPPPKAGPTEREKFETQKACVEKCAAAFNACIVASGCKAKSGSGGTTQYDCAGDAALKGVACKDDVNACGAKCK